MSELLKDLTVEGFADITASDAPAPGGGSVSAMAGAMGAALAAMVANLTIGKKKYAAVEEEMKTLAAKATDIKKRLIEGIDKDASSFNLYMDALGMPKDTEEQKEARKAKMQEGLKAAAKVPMECAETVAEIFPIAKAVVENGNTNAVTDGLIAAMMARTAVIGAVLNVRINLGSIQDDDFVTEYAAKCLELEKLAVLQEREILGMKELSNQIL